MQPVSTNFMHPGWVMNFSAVLNRRSGEYLKLPKDGPLHVQTPADTLSTDSRTPYFIE